MARQGQRLHFTVAQLGPLKRAEAENSIGVAGRVQQAFGFDMLPGKFDFDAVKYRLPNRGFDLEAAVKDCLRNRKLPRPLILLTSAPFSDCDYGTDPDYFFHSMTGVNNDDIALISTYLWEHLPGRRRVQPFLLYELAETVLDWCIDIPCHDETRGCLCDYCEDPKDIDRGFELGPFCNSCEQHIEHELRVGTLGVEQIASVRRLFNRAVERKVCFVVMPFRRELDPVYEAIGGVLRDKGWTVVRADEIERPRSITDAIMQAIFMSDLVVADLTGNNENVYYELGVAHAVGCDTIILTQESSVPFDIKTEQTVFYKNNKRGIAHLADRLKKVAGRG